MAKLFTKVHAVCADYNGHKDIDFMLKADDFRLTDPRFAGKYTVVDAKPLYCHKTRTLRSTRGFYKVCSDWSLKPIG